ncbi:MAG TPA: hypothetical protein VFR40_10870 [Lapillicoccus sp.]|nr:hypothetical protein [Lapillicoccus sp.]
MRAVPVGDPTTTVLSEDAVVEPELAVAVVAAVEATVTDAVDSAVDVVLEAEDDVLLWSRRARDTPMAIATSSAVPPFPDMTLLH